MAPHTPRSFGPPRHSRGGPLSCARSTGPRDGPHTPRSFGPLRHSRGGPLSCARSTGPRDGRKLPVRSVRSGEAAAHLDPARFRGETPRTAFEQDPATAYMCASALRPSGRGHGTGLALRPWLAMATASSDKRDFVQFIGRLKETQTLLAVAQALSLRLEAPEAMRRVAREVALAFGADMVGAYACDPTRPDALVAIAGYHVPENLRDWFGRTPMVVTNSPKLDLAWRTRSPAWTADAAKD